jgi:hypothetical protein
MRHASDCSFVIVTDNASDFRRLYADETIHAGLIIIIPNVGRLVQQQLFSGALDELSQLGEPVNRVLEVNLDSDEVTFEFYDLP